LAKLQAIAAGPGTRAPAIPALLLIGAGGRNPLFFSFAPEPVSMLPDSAVAERWSGRLYTTSNNRRLQGSFWTDWFLQKSKKVWFRIPSARLDPEAPWVYSYSGLPILHRRTWKLLPASERTRLTPVILWGDEVASGWGEGPEGTNHFLYIWTRWSLWHPGAWGQPERFAVQVGPLRAGEAQGAGERGLPGGDS
jgi:hypothetical protein